MKFCTFDEHISRRVDLGVPLEHIVFRDKAQTTKEDIRVPIMVPDKCNEYHQKLRVAPDRLPIKRIRYTQYLESTKIVRSKKPHHMASEAKRAETAEIAEEEMVTHPYKQK